MQKVYEQIIRNIKRYFLKSGQHRITIGVSGGVDSTLTLKLLVDAVGSQKITALSLPEYGVTSPLNQEHAKVLSEAMGVLYFNHPINSYLVSFTQLPWRPSETANINNKARIRAAILYNYANTANALVAGTTNRSELLLGYGTKFGDLACDFMPIGDLYKEEVVSLADFLGLPREIIEKKPSAELYPGQTDEAELGATYAELDPILKRHEIGSDKLIERGMSPTLVHNVLNRIEKNSHKSAPPYIIKIKREQI
jgi:NAD+ synthase